MGKKKHAEEHENLERWLVSYADFITLLFATFVVLYALSQIDLAKFKDLKVSLQKAFSPPSIIQGETSILDSSGNTLISQGNGSSQDFNVIEAMMSSGMKDVEKTVTEIKNDLKEVKEGDIKTELNNKGLVISVLDSLLFGSGSAELRKEAHPVLLKLAAVINKKFPKQLVSIEGHTDNIPMKSVIFPSNWELSSARASSVVRFLIGKTTIAENRFAAVGYSDSRPVFPNDNENNRKKNRRVEIVIERNKIVESLSPVATAVNEKQEIKKIESLSHKNNNINKYGNVSEAVKKLLQETGQGIQDVIFDNDPYQKENERIAKELKEKELKKKKELNLPDLKPKNSSFVSKEEINIIESAHKDGKINNAVADLMKQRGNVSDAIIIKEEQKH